MQINGVSGIGYKNSQSFGKINNTLSSYSIIEQNIQNAGFRKAYKNFDKESGSRIFELEGCDKGFIIKEINSDNNTYTDFIVKNGRSATRALKKAIFRLDAKV